MNPKLSLRDGRIYWCDAPDDWLTYAELMQAFQELAHSDLAIEDMVYDVIFSHQQGDELFEIRLHKIHGVRVGDFKRTIYLVNGRHIKRDEWKNRFQIALASGII